MPTPPAGASSRSLVRWAIVAAAGLATCASTGCTAGRAPRAHRTRDTETHAPANAETPPGAADASSRARGLAVRSYAQLPRLHFMRQALSEMAVDGPAKEQAIALIDAALGDMAALIAQADRDPDSAEALVPGVRQVHETTGAGLQRLLAPNQLRALGERVQQMGMQASFLCQPADDLRRAFANFRPTPEQAAKIDRFIAEEAAELRKAVPAPDTSYGRLLESIDRLGPAALAARAKLRTVLTEEQFRRFDTGFSMDTHAGRPADD